MISYEYKGNTFGIEKEKSWYGHDKDTYTIVQMNICVDDVYVPDHYEGYAITSLIIRSGQEQKGIKAKMLYIPAELTSIQIENNYFPNLQEVYVDAGNKKYSSNGKMIFSKDGTHLLYCLVTKGKSIEIPAEVKEIERYAFYGTEYTDIVVTKKEIAIADGAFYGSKWLAVHQNMAIIGNMLYDADFKNKCLEVPPEVKRFQAGIFSEGKIPKKLISTFMPTQHDISCITKRDVCKSFELNSVRKNLNIQLLRKWDSLEEIIITEKNRTYKTVDGVLFTKDGRTLVFYPPAKNDSRYKVPEGVKKIAEKAFANQRYLEVIRMPRFTGCKKRSMLKLRQIVYWDGKKRSIEHR